MILIFVGCKTMCWANRMLFAVVVLLWLSSLLSGCGKTGPLYLPDDEKQQTARH
jgi:predicted small lipoprotein YifL